MFWTIGVLLTIGNERVAISRIVVELEQKFCAVSSITYDWPTWIPTQPPVWEIGPVRSGRLEQEDTFCTLIKNWTGMLLIGVVEVELTKSSI